MENVENVYSLNECYEHIQAILPQLSRFIEQFDAHIKVNNLNIVTDANGFNVDVPANMPEQAARVATKRVEVLDSLIDAHRTSLKDLFRQGFAHESVIKANNSNYTSILIDKHTEFQRIAAKYKHYAD
jgi:hypothetical protein